MVSFRIWWALGRLFRSPRCKKGDRVGLVSKNCLEFIVTYFAVIKAGGVIVPINFQLVPREIAYIVKDTAMKLLVVKPRRCLLQNRCRSFLLRL